MQIKNERTLLLGTDKDLTRSQKAWNVKVEGYIKKREVIQERERKIKKKNCLKLRQ